MKTHTHPFRLAAGLAILLVGVLWFSGIGGIVATPQAAAQGVLIAEDPGTVVILPRPMPRPPISPPIVPVPVPPTRPSMAYHISEIDVQTKITDAAAEVMLSQTFVNDGSTQIEAAFVFPLPYDSVITEMTLLVDGKEYAAKAMKADEARSYYESIVRRNRDPALLEWMGRGLFKTSVFPIPAGAKRTVTLRYVQVLRRTDGLTDFLFPLATARYATRSVDKLNFRVAIESADEIKNIYSPSHGVTIERPTLKNAVVTFTETNKTPTADFRLLYDVGRDTLGAKLMSYASPKSGDAKDNGDDEGFFALFATPTLASGETETPTPKTVVLVVDRSGSMSGEKIKQARGALRYILENLRKDDLFNIVAYDSRVESFRPELQRFDDETKKAAIAFVEGLYAGGSTNIGDALRTAFASLSDRERPTYVLFLTDGCPTTGVTSEAGLLKIASEENKCGARLMVFGVGYDVNASLLDKMALNGRGVPAYVRPDENIEEQVSALWRKIETPVLTDVKFEIALDEANDSVAPLVSRVYPAEMFDLFAGEQMVVVGRYKRPGAAKVTLTGTFRGEKKSWDFPAVLVASDDAAAGNAAFVEPLWAMRRVTEILDEIDAKGRNEELVKELVDLATRHGIVTPYTSFMADENSEVGATATNVARSGNRLGSRSATSGALGVEQRRVVQNLRAQQNLAYSADSFADRDVVRAMETAAPSVSSPTVLPRGGGVAAMASGGGRGMAGPGSMGSMTGGYGGGSFSGTAESSVGDIAESAKELAQAVTTMRNVNGRAFYQRSGIWIDGTLSATQQKEPTPIVLKQFSTEMFSLQKANPEITPYLTFDEPVLLNVGGKVYRIEP